MTNPALLILAAGMGSRYSGVKWHDQVGPSGESILEYSLFDARRAGFPATEFFDPIHLDRSGASAYTDAIASVLERVPSSRWIALPGPSTRPPADSVEDLSESVIALRAASRR